MPKKEQLEKKALQGMLDELLAIGKPVFMPPPQPFFADEAEAHKWNIPIVASYLTDELELPQYKDAFARHEINGHALVCLDEETIVRKFDPSDSMHVTKIAAHAALLREKVLEGAAKGVTGQHLSDWDYGQVAGWLKYRQNCPSVALSALKKKVDGSQLVDLRALVAKEGSASKDEDTKRDEKGSEAEGLARALESLMWGEGPPPEEMAAACAALAQVVRAEHKRLSALEERVSPRPPAPPAGRKRESAMSRRRKREGGEEQLEGINEEKEEEVEGAVEDAEVPIVVVDEKANPAVVQKKKKNDKKERKGEGVPTDRKEEEAVSKGDPNPKVSKQEQEGKEFQKQISELQKLIETQARSYEKLSVAADELRRAKEQSDHDLKERDAEQRRQQALIEELEVERARAEQERQTALMEKATISNTLAVASSKFFKDLDQERARREREMEEHRVLLEQRKIDEMEAAARVARIGIEAAVAEGLIRPELKGTPGVAGAVAFAAGAGSKGLVGRIRLQGLGAAALGDAVPLWEGFLDQYRYRDDGVSPTTDTRSFQQRIYSLWLQLGSRMHDDLLLAKVQRPPSADLEMLTALERCCKHIITTQMPKEQAATAVADRYVMSICFVYVLGCIKKTIARSGTGKAEQAQIASALSNLREGILTHCELSRENLKLIFSDTLGVAFSNFYAFDAICQRVDVGRKGVISLYPDVLGSFSQLTPLYTEVVRLPSMGGVHCAQAVVLTLLTLASEHVVSYVFTMKKGASLEDVFIDLVTARLDTVPSFRTYALERRSDRPPEASRGAEVVHLMQLVADVLFEMARPFLCSTHASSREGGARELALLPRIRSASSSGRGDRDSAALEWLQTHARDVCMAVARSLQLYGNSSSSECMESLAAFFLTFLSFRLASLKALSERILPVGMRPYSRIHRKDAEETAAGLEALVNHFAGEEETKEILRNTSSAKIHSFEVAIAGATGFFLPEQCRLPLVCAQCDAEHFAALATGIKKGPSRGDKGSVLTQLVRRLKEGGEEKKAYMGMLSDVRCSLELDVFRPSSAPAPAERPGKENSSPQRSPNKRAAKAEKRERQLTKRSIEQAQSQAVSEVNIVLHNQRIAALSSYLEYLNTRAHSKKGILEVLLNLYKAATALSKGNAHDIVTADGFAVTLSRVELVKKASEMQSAILEDMQRVPNVATQQLAKRVEKLRNMLELKKVEDADRGIALYLEQIRTMEQVLLQSNTDAISITTKIVNKLR